jgi:hypothetical protein
MTRKRPSRRQRYIRRYRRFFAPWQRFWLWYYRVTLVLTCVGGMLHESAHVAACKLFGVPIHEVCYFRVDDPSGYVLYTLPRRYSAQIAIPLAPWLSNTVLASVLFLGVIGGLDRWGLPPLAWECATQWKILVGYSWLGFACAFHAPPSRTDTALAWDATLAQFPSLGTLCASPLVLTAQLLSHCNRYGLELVYTGGLIGGMVTLYHTTPWLRTATDLFVQHTIQFLSGTP